MTTAIEAILQPKTWAALLRVVPVANATFYTYPSQSDDPAISKSTPGTATPIDARITPPEDYREQFGDVLPGLGVAASSSVGSEDIGKKIKTLLLTGVGVAPITFTPELGQEVEFPKSSGDIWRILSLNTLRPGDDVIAYELILAESSQ